MMVPATNTIPSVWMVSKAGKNQLDVRIAAFNRVLSSHWQMLSKNMETSLDLLSRYNESKSSTLRDSPARSQE
jgi:hypothetical protein